MSQLKPQDAANVDDFISDIKSKIESLGNILVSRDKTAGESKSADEVSFTKERE